jgi:hypothetical protein
MCSSIFCVQPVRKNSSSQNRLKVTESNILLCPYLNLVSIACLSFRVGAGHLLRCVHPELRIHGNPRLPHVRRRRQLPSDAEPAGGKDQLEAGHLHDPDQPVLQVRPDGVAARDGRRGEAAARRQHQEARQQTGPDPPRGQHGRVRACGALLRPPHGARRLAPQRRGLDAAPLHLLPQDLRRHARRQGGGRAGRGDHRAWFTGRCDGDLLFSEEDCSRVLSRCSFGNEYSN